jgi:hypothetical protein
MALRPFHLSSALAIAILSACQAPPVTSTVVCAMNSDCPDRLVCVDSRCIEECVSQHDCLRGTHCAVWNELGSCVIDTPLDHTSSPCGPTRQCDGAPEATCRDFSCWSSCTTSADCVADSYCRQGLCVNPESPGFGYGTRTSCTSARDCATGEICATDHGSERVCRRPCSANDDCGDIAATPLCAAIDDPSMPTGTMACVIGCDPVRQLGCYGHDRCEVNVAAGPSGMATFLECRAPTGMGIQGVACGTTAPMFGACDQNLGCAPAMADVGGGYECRRFCVIDGDCRSDTLGCTGPAAPGIQNTSAVTGVLHMCEPL